MAADTEKNGHLLMPIGSGAMTQLAIHTHARDGSLLILAGAMLRMTVMNHVSAGEAPSFQPFFNLCKIYCASIEKREKEL
jgi:hypothetical protein